jgi:E3 ubiquitin-protein ligase RNF115/126
MGLILTDASQPRFIRHGHGPNHEAGITGPVMAQYLMALLGQRGALDPLGSLFSMGMGDNATERGRWGDYVFNQEGRLDLFGNRIDHLDNRA